jgi:hypothetical protein
LAKAAQVLAALNWQYDPQWEAFPFEARDDEGNRNHLEDRIMESQIQESTLLLKKLCENHNTCGVPK